MSKAERLHGLRASLGEVRGTLDEIEDKWGFGCKDDPIDDDEDGDDAYEYDQLSTDLETALDTIAEDLAQIAGVTNADECAVDELMARYIGDGLVTPEAVTIAAALVDALGSRGSQGDRTSELLMGPSHEQLLRVVVALERIVDHEKDRADE